MTDAAEDYKLACRALDARLDALTKPEPWLAHGGLKMAITPGLAFVLLALAEGHATGTVQPAFGWTDDAAAALRLARPGGNQIVDRAFRGRPARTFGSDEPQVLAAPRHAYVHVTNDGMIEIVCGQFVDVRHGLVGLGLIEQSAKHDAQALLAAFKALGLEGPLIVATALLRTDGVRVSDATFSGRLREIGTLRARSIRLAPRRFVRRADLTGARLQQLVADLWKKAADEAVPAGGETT